MDRAQMLAVVSMSRLLLQESTGQWLADVVSNYVTGRKRVPLYRGCQLAYELSQATQMDHKRGLLALVVVLTLHDRTFMPRHAREELLGVAQALGQGWNPDCSPIDYDALRDKVESYYTMTLVRLGGPSSDAESRPVAE